MGNELKRDTCPEKYCKKGNLIKDTIPVLIALVIVAVFSGSLFDQSGMNTVVTVIIEVIFFAAMYGVIYWMLGKSKANLAKTYIAVCENGVCGVYAAGGFTSKPFELSYTSVTKLTVKGERLYIYSPKATVSLTLNDAEGIAALIRSNLT